MKTLDWVQLCGYAFGGMLAASRGDLITASKCFILAATSLVPQETAQEHLTAASVDRVNLEVDTDEVVKFGRLS